MAKCVYCKTALPGNSVFDVCKSCGFQVWGENMYNAIVGNMEAARDKGDLYQGSVTEHPQQAKPSFSSSNSKPTTFIQSPAPNLGATPAGFSLVQDAVSQLEESQKPQPEPSPPSEPQPAPPADSMSTLDGMREAVLSPPAEDLIEESPFIVDTSKTGF